MGPQHSDIEIAMPFCVPLAYPCGMYYKNIAIVGDACTINNVIHDSRVTIQLVALLLRSS